MHAACAFLNTEGGWLIFGITPSSLKIIGQEVTDNTQREIAQALSGLEPAVDVRPDYIDVPERPGNKVVPPKHPLSTPQIDLLVESIGQNYVPLRELAEACKITNLKYFREMFIKPALDLGIIERLYPDHPKHPKQKYRLRRDLKDNNSNQTQGPFQEGEQAERKKSMRVMLSFGIPPEKIAEEYGISVQDVLRLAQTQ